MSVEVLGFGAPSDKQMHVRITPDMKLAIQQIAAMIARKPHLSVQITRRGGKITNTTVIRYALGRVLEDLA